MLQELMLITPEIWVLCMACIILLVDLIWPKRKQLILLMSQVTALGAAGLSWHLYGQEPTLLFQEQWVFDNLSNALKMIMGIVIFTVFTYGGRYLSPRGLAKGEYYVLALLSFLGMMVLVSSYSLLTFYMGIELLSLPLYVLVAFNRHDPVAIEAGMKYFVLGGLASGLMLYGMSLIYGATGEVGFVALQHALSAEVGVNPILIQFGLMFMFVGLFFKLGAAPFHMWIPDVYSGATTTVALFIASAPKLAAFGITYRLLAEVFWQYADFWQQLLVIIAILSLAIGNIIALAQTNIKRLLGYSAVAHVGFITLGLLAGPQAGYDAALTYAIIYVMTTTAAFGLVIFMSRAGYELEEMNDLKGLGQRSPLIAFLFLLVLFALAGVPPMVGFYAKLLVLQALVDAGWVWLAVLSVAFTVIGAFYYIRVVRLIYFDDPVSYEEPNGGSASMKALLTVNGLAMLVLGLLPGLILPLCQAILR